MALLTDPTFWARLVGIAFLNLLLSGDNALVIALAVRRLPRRLRLLGQIWGTVGAVVLRLLFVTLVSYLLQWPFLRLVGGGLLVWIAVRLVRPDGGDSSQVRHGTSFWEAMWIIIIADVTMSLDNVLAIAAAAHGDLLLVVLGIGLSLPIVIGGAGILAVLMNRYAWVVWLGGGVLAWVGVDMALEDPWIEHQLGAAAGSWSYAVSAGAAAVVTFLGWWFARGARGADEGTSIKA